jgi:hypothetical protein
LRQVILHEVSHLRRRDDWTNLGQQILKALLFFHPAVWWIERRISLEREMACDDMVLRQTSDRRTYAECLVTMAEKSYLHRALMLAHAAVTRMRDTTRRVHRILEPAPQTSHSWKLFPAAASIALIAGVFANGVPQLVRFADDAASGIATAQTISPAAIAPATLVHPAALRESRPSAVTPTVLKDTSRRPATHQEPARTADLRMHRVPAPRVQLAKAVASDVAPQPYGFVVLIVQSSTDGAMQWQTRVWTLVLRTPPNSLTNNAHPRKAI